MCTCPRVKRTNKNNNPAHESREKKAKEEQLKIERKIGENRKSEKNRAEQNSKTGAHFSHWMMRLTAPLVSKICGVVKELTE